MLFVGDVWQQNRGDYRNLQNLLVDFYRGDVVDKLILSGIDHMMVFTAAAATTTASPGGEPSITIHQRTYFCKLKKNPNSASSSSAAPVPYLEPCGPDLDFVLQRTQWCADGDTYRASRKVPPSLKPKKKKNQTTNAFGETLGRLHVSRQDVEKSSGRKSKALRRAEKIDKEEEAAAVEEGLKREEEQMEHEL
jgi:ribosome production factor 2